MTNDLYRQELMEHYKFPQNKGVIDGAMISKHGVNKMCGDEIDIYLVVENGVIKDFKFSGDSCAVSTISASLLTEELVGKTLDQAEKYSKEDLLKLIGVQLSTSRVKCAALILDTLKEGIHEYSSKQPKR